MKSNRKHNRFFGKEIKKNFFNTKTRENILLAEEANKVENSEKEYTELYLQTTRWQTI